MPYDLACYQTRRGVPTRNGRLGSGGVEPPSEPRSRSRTSDPTMRRHKSTATAKTGAGVGNRPLPRSRSGVRTRPSGRSSDRNDTLACARVRECLSTFPIRSYPARNPGRRTTRGGSSDTTTISACEPSATTSMRSRATRSAISCVRWTTCSTPPRRCSIANIPSMSPCYGVHHRRVRAHPAATGLKMFLDLGE